MKNSKKDFSNYLFLVPALIIYLSVLVIPLFYSAFISLHKWNGIKEKVFVGFDNYAYLITEDKIFMTSLKNNLIWVVLTLLITMTVALVFAVVLNQNFAGRTFFRALFYFPTVISAIAVAIIWRWIYNPNIGFINQFFSAIGLDYSQSWLSDPSVSLYGVFIAALWQGIGQPMIIFLAGLQMVPLDVLEAAKIDGASDIKRFFLITIPLMKESFVIVIATLVIASLKVFDVIVGLTGGGPNNATQMLSTYMYSQTFKYNNVGLGTSISVLMVLIMMTIVIPYVAFTAKEDS